MTSFLCSLAITAHTCLKVCSQYVACPHTASYHITPPSQHVALLRFIPFTMFAGHTTFLYSLLKKVEILSSIHKLAHSFLNQMNSPAMDDGHYSSKAELQQQLMLFAVIRLLRRRRRAERRIWVCPIFMCRRRRGKYHNLLQEIEAG